MQCAGFFFWLLAMAEVVGMDELQTRNHVACGSPALS
jgi:hypothetical protein